MIYFVQAENTDDFPLIPVADGSYYTGSMVIADKFIEHDRGDFAIVFFDEDGVTPITPTGGTVTPLMAVTEHIYMQPGEGDLTIYAKECIVESDGIALYNVPTFAAGAKRGKVTFKGITGATFAQAEFRRYK
jgi:hypothetical protein